MQTTYKDHPVTTGATTTGVDVNTAVVTPVDRVRLPSIVAGILTTLATLVALSLLGLAIGLARYDGTGNDNALGLGAGIWGGISALIAFFLGGFVAARSSATASGPKNGIFNGAIMWMAAIVLIIVLIGGSIGSLLGLAGGVASTAITAAVPVAGQAAQNAAEGGVAAAPAAGAAAAAATTVPDIVGQVQSQNTSANRDQIAQDASQAAWGVLLTLGLSAAAALIGGAMGASADRRDRIVGAGDQRTITES